MQQLKPKTNMKTTLATIAIISGLSFCPTFAADTSSPSIIITASKDTPYASVTKIFDACKTAGLNNVALRSNLAGDTNNLSFILIASKDTPYARFVEILDACKAAGLSNVGLQTTPSKEATK